eukprot:2498706-Rhodomonas_salina.1
MTGTGAGRAAGSGAVGLAAVAGRCGAVTDRNGRLGLIPPLCLLGAPALPALFSLPHPLSLPFPSVLFPCESLFIP